jgi:peroxidase
MIPPATILSLLVVLGCSICESVAYENSEQSRLHSEQSSLQADEFYAYDGLGNNLEQPAWGASNKPRARLLPSFAGFWRDGVPRDETNSGLPSARRVMEQVFRQAKPRKDKASNDMLLQFGLFIVFDVLGKGGNSSEPFPVPCDGELTDLLFCPVTGQVFNNETPDNKIHVLRNQHTMLAGANNPNHLRASINKGTAFLDLGSIYGTTPEAVSKVRLHEGGLLAMDANGLPLDKSPRKYNSSPGAFSYIVVFMRFHNQIANKYAQDNPNWTDEELFQGARQYTIAVYQSIIADKYLPALLGDFTLNAYQGYDPTVDPSIDEFFASLSFRYGHSSLSNLVRLLDGQFQPTPQDPLFLRDVFRQPSPNDVP